MNFAGTAALGAVAGFTIYLGLPVARLGRLDKRWMALLNAGSIGVLLFLLYDVIGKANQSVEQHLADSRLAGTGYGLMLATGLTVSMLGLVLFERLALRREKTRTGGPGALAVGTFGGVAADADDRPRVRQPLTQAQRVALFIAVGIGAHNLSEGLAIGQSARVGAYSLFGVLVIGFGLHNITEGFGITAPLLTTRPSWRFLGLLGLVGGGPTFLGTIIGYQTTNEALAVLFFALAAGAIIYVVGELMHAGRRIGNHDLAMVGLLAGFLLAYGTDKLLFVAGG